MKKQHVRMMAQAGNQALNSVQSRPGSGHGDSGAGSSIPPGTLSRSNTMVNMGKNICRIKKIDEYRNIVFLSPEYLKSN